MVRKHRVRRRDVPRESCMLRLMASKTPCPSPSILAARRRAPEDEEREERARVSRMKRISEYSAEPDRAAPIAIAPPTAIRSHKPAKKYAAMHAREAGELERATSPRNATHAPVDRARRDGFIP